MDTLNIGEQLLSEIVVSLHELLPGIDFNKVKNNLSGILAHYKVEHQEDYKYESDFPDKVKLFIASKKIEGLSENTLDGYKRELRLFSNAVNKKVEHITSGDIRVYLGNLEGRKMSTIGKKLTTIKSFFSFLLAEEMIQRDPTLKIKQPKEEKRLGKSLTIEELELLRETCKTTRQRALLEVLYCTGCRLSEICNLNKSDINMQNMSCRVIGKGNKEREVYFSYKALYHLRKYFLERPDQNEALFVSERRPYGRLSNKGIQREIDVIEKAANIDKKVTPHVMRHTFATLTLNNGADITAVQELLGHSSPETTLRYARITEERKREQHKKYLVQ
ncbi:site-specific tyrosine recombinase/integron integrase [Peribacillus loiseleuriae]|uniref:site-specific tyrosine recombinase/integron integrase n=1 Tax=Peribacillus loiseleuriae TaxID=1679170 RepID=UPI003827E792